MDGDPQNAESGTDEGKEHECHANMAGIELADC